MNFKSFFLIGNSRIDFDVFFFRYNHRNLQNWSTFQVIGKKLKKKPTIFPFSSKNWLLWMQKMFLNYNRAHSDRFVLNLSVETIRIQNFNLSQKSWWKNCWKISKLLCYRKAHSFKTIKYIVTKFDRSNWSPEWKWCWNFTTLSFILS